MAAGADGVFLEFHPDPDKALCDGPSCPHCPSRRSGITCAAPGGPPLIGKTPPYRQRLDLLAAPGLQEREIDRLLSLGATRLDTGQDRVVVLADPDGNELWVRP